MRCLGKAFQKKGDSSGKCGGRAAEIGEGLGLSLELFGLSLEVFGLSLEVFGCSISWNLSSALLGPGGEAREDGKSFSLWNSLGWEANPGQIKGLKFKCYFYF